MKAKCEALSTNLCFCSLPFRRISSTDFFLISSQEKAEEKYGAVSFKVFYDFNNQKLQVEGRFGLANSQMSTAYKYTCSVSLNSTERGLSY